MEPQFRHTEDLWQRLVNWVDAHLHVGVPTFFGGWVRYVAIAVLLAVLGAVLGFIFRYASLGRMHRQKAPGVVVTDGDVALSASAWRQEADRLAAEGKYRDAVRCRYRALVAELADRGLIDQVPGRTSGDYERIVRALVPEVSEQFSYVTRLFERCWYGHEASDAKAQVVFDEAAKAVLAAVGSARWTSLAHNAAQWPSDLVSLK
jgi:hypothetical protein